MPFLLYQCTRYLRRGVWRLPLAIEALSFVIGWFGTAYFERGRPLSQFSNYWYFYDVVAKTIGFGDYSPATQGGRLVFSITSDMSIVGFTLLATGLAGKLLETKLNRMKGLAKVDVKNHLVIVGYHPGRTLKIIKAYLSRHPNAEIVIAETEERQSEHPMPDLQLQGVHFVRGPLDDESMLARVSANKAHRILVDVAHDHERMFVCLMVRQCLPEADMVAPLCNLDKSPRFAGLGGVAYMSWHMVLHVIDELLQPGVSRFHEKVVNCDDSSDGTELVQLPENFPENTPLGEFRNWLRATHKATVVCVNETVNPDDDHELHSGDKVIYLGSRELSAQDLGPFLNIPALA